MGSINSKGLGHVSLKHALGLQDPSIATQTSDRNSANRDIESTLGESFVFLEDIDAKLNPEQASHEFRTPSPIHSPPKPSDDSAVAQSPPESGNALALKPSHSQSSDQLWSQVLMWTASLSTRAVGPLCPMKGNTIRDEGGEGASRAQSRESPFDGDNESRGIMQLLKTVKTLSNHSALPPSCIPSPRGPYQARRTTHWWLETRPFATRRLRMSPLFSRSKHSRR
jgi:hypothetical protein